MDFETSVFSRQIFSSVHPETFSGRSYDVPQLNDIYMQGRIQDLSDGVARFFRNKKLIIRNKIKGLGQGFRNNKKIVQELGTKI